VDRERGMRFICFIANFATGCQWFSGQHSIEGGGGTGWGHTEGLTNSNRPQVQYLMVLLSDQFRIRLVLYKIGLESYRYKIRYVPNQIGSKSDRFGIR
jgi:hypothetical protein